MQNTLLGYGLLPEICTDAAGGVYVAYETPISPPRRIEIRRLDRFGIQAWAAPRVVSGTASQSINSRLSEDGKGGAIVSFVDYEGPGDEHVRVQRVDSAGNFLWGATGIRASVSEDPQADPEIVTDGRDGCIVAWFDISSSIRAQRIDSLGNRMWGDSGIHLYDGSSRPLIESDGFGGFFVFRGTTLIQRYSHVGVGMWGADGVQIANIGVQIFTSDNNGGVVIAGMKMIDFNNGDPYWRALGQRLDSTGQVLWALDGTVVAESLQNTGPGSPPRIHITSNAQGETVFAFSDRVGMNTQSFVQRIASDGSPRFPGDGVRVSGLETTVNKPSDVTTSISASQIVILEDSRNNGSIFAQRIDSSGSRFWGSNDIAISLRNLSFLSSVTDGNGGVVVVGFDQSDFSLRAQQCNYLGELGEVEPVSVREQPPVFPLTPLLYQNYPNPFNGSTTIQYSIPVGTYGHTSLRVYDLLGREVMTLVDGEMEAGAHSVQLDGRKMASGLYFYKLTAGKYTAVKKMVLTK
ncbi:MAG: T9SS type A sorting domain-containing protein [Bacteroidota bacterium]